MNSRLGVQLRVEKSLVMFAVLMLTARTVLAMDLVVPAYFYPSGNGATAWNTLANNAASVPVTAIVNPNSGPGTSADPAYTNAISKVRGAGGKVIGYVHTSYGNRSLNDVYADINAYRKFYTLDGFFVDEMANDNSNAHVQYYQTLYKYIKGLSTKYQIVNNPGSNIPEVYAKQPVADRFVVYENKQASYSQYRPASWQSNYPACRFVHMVYDASASQVDGDLQMAASNRAEGVFITSLTLPNPYNDLPPYWAQEVSAVASRNSKKGR